MRSPHTTTREQSPLSTTRESPHTAMKTQHSQKQIHFYKSFLKILIFRRAEGRTFVFCHLCINFYFKDKHLKRVQQKLGTGIRNTKHKLPHKAVQGVQCMGTLSREKKWRLKFIVFLPFTKPHILAGDCVCGEGTLFQYKQRHRSPLGNRDAFSKTQL